MAHPQTPPPGTGRLPALCCSFCTKEQSAVAKLRAGRVHLQRMRFATCAEGLAPSLGGWNEQPDDQLLASLARVQAAVVQADAAVHDHVAILRGRGISWTRIGEALGVSKQAAWERFSGED